MVGLLCHIGAQDLKEPRIVATRFDVVFTPRSLSMMMQFSDNPLPLRLLLLKLGKGNRRRIEYRNLLKNTEKG